MKLGPKFKIAKRLGAPIFEKTQTQKFAISQARGGRPKKRQAPPSDYKKQLIEKQKMRFPSNGNVLLFLHAENNSTHSTGCGERLPGSQGRITDRI